MRLLMFRADGTSRLGALRPGHDDEVVELPEPAGMLALIDAGDEGLARVRSALSSSRSRTHKLKDLDRLPPLPDPRGNVIAIGPNYHHHADETPRAAAPDPSP